MKDWKKSFGMILSKFYQMAEDIEAMDNDMSLWGAPGECFQDMYRGYFKGVKNEFERLFSEYGIRSMKEIKKEYNRRTSGYKAYEIFLRLFPDSSDWEYDPRYRVETA